jgi:hypothetical protein
MTSKGGAHHGAISATHQSVALAVSTIEIISYINILLKVDAIVPGGCLDAKTFGI